MFKKILHSTHIAFNSTLAFAQCNPLGTTEHLNFPNAFQFGNNKKFQINLLIVSVFLLLSAHSFGQTYTDANPAAPNTWTVPAGVTSIDVEVWGAGGAGGGSTVNNDGGAGGGGGA